MKEGFLSESKLIQTILNEEAQRIRLFAYGCIYGFLAIYFGGTVFFSIILAWLRYVDI